MDGWMDRLLEWQTDIQKESQTDRQADREIAGRSDWDNQEGGTFEQSQFGVTF